MKFFLRQSSSFLAPIFFCIIFPYLIIAGRHRESEINPTAFLVVLGGAVCLAGLVLFILSVRMLILIGNGTIMPWDPSRKLVTGSLYGYVRNPMILSLIIILAGEALLFDSIWLAVLGLAFFIINTVYFQFSEEPGLEKRFGQEYVEYKKHVPRWIPNLKPWHPGMDV